MKNKTKVILGIAAVGVLTAAWFAPSPPSVQTPELVPLSVASPPISDAEFRKLFDDFTTQHWGMIAAGVGLMSIGFGAVMNFAITLLGAIVQGFIWAFWKIRRMPSPRERREEQSRLEQTKLANEFYQQIRASLEGGQGSL